MLTIAAGVFVGGLALYLTVKWLERRKELRAAYDLGQQAAGGAVDAVEHAIADLLVRYHVTYFPTLEARVREHVSNGPTDGLTVRDQAIIEVSAMMDSVRSQIDSNARDVEEECAEWLALMGPGEVERIREAIKQRIEARTTELHLNAMLKIGEIIIEGEQSGRPAS